MKDARSKIVHLASSARKVGTRSMGFDEIFETSRCARHFMLGGTAADGAIELMSNRALSQRLNRGHVSCKSRRDGDSPLARSHVEPERCTIESLFVPR